MYTSNVAIYYYYSHSTHARTQLFNTSFSGTTWVGRYQKGKTNLDFTEARDSSISWAVCKSLQTDNHTSTPPLSFLQVGCPSCRPTNSVKALMVVAQLLTQHWWINHFPTTVTSRLHSLLLFGHRFAMHSIRCK